MGRTTSASALRYALHELGRRAGVTEQLMSRWRVQHDGARLLLYPDPQSAACVEFPYDPSKAARVRELRERPASRYSWMAHPDAPEARLIPDFVVPFQERSEGGPLFARRMHGDVVARADVLTATLWMLSRIEERDPPAVDEHGRVRAADSVVYRAGAIERPIVDEYGLAFAQALEALMPGWKPAARRLRVKLSHDIDRIGYPRTPRTSIALLAKYRNPLEFARDGVALAGIGAPAYLRAIDTVAGISRRRALDSAFYFKAALRASEHDTGYDLTQQPIRACIERLAEIGFEIGLHPGYETFESQAALEAEVMHLRRVVADEPIGGRQHYLRWLPRMWEAWERAELAYDSSVGYAEAMGFRAGTCIPYHPWSIEEDRRLRLLEIPLVVMDCTPLLYMGLDARTTIQRVRALIERCRNVGGVFTLLWHNTGVIEHPFARIYRPLLELLGEHDRYDWRAERT